MSNEKIPDSLKDLLNLLEKIKDKYTDDDDVKKLPNVLYETMSKIKDLHNLEIDNLHSKSKTHEEEIDKLNKQLHEFKLSIIESRNQYNYLVKTSEQALEDLEKKTTNKMINLCISMLDNFKLASVYFENVDENILDGINMIITFIIKELNNLGIKIKEANLGDVFDYNFYEISTILDTLDKSKDNTIFSIITDCFIYIKDNTVYKPGKVSIYKFKKN